MFSFFSFWPLCGVACFLCFEIKTESLIKSKLKSAYQKCFIAFIYKVKTAYFWPSKVKDKKKILSEVYKSKAFIVIFNYFCLLGILFVFIVIFMAIGSTIFLAQASTWKAIQVFLWKKSWINWITLIIRQLSTRRNV